MIYYLSSFLKGNYLNDFPDLHNKNNKYLILTVCTMDKFKDDNLNWEYHWGIDGKERYIITNELSLLGIPESNLFFYNYLDGSGWIEDATHLLISGGDVELGLIRINEHGLWNKIIRFKGDIIAYSAGALMLFDKFFLSPNYYYPSMKYCEGLGLISDSRFLIEVHYDHSKDMDKNIRYASKYYQKQVFGISNDGMLTYDLEKDTLTLFGDVSLFNQDIEGV